jgi:hypothetical protein
MDQKELGTLIVVCLILMIGGFGYIYEFSTWGIDLSPVGKDQGIQLSPSANCREICVNGVFMGCEKSFDDLSCGLSCRGIISSGPMAGEMPTVGSTLCGYTECVCN